MTDGIIDLVRPLRDAFDDVDGLALLRGVLNHERLRGRTALVSSFGAESAVLLDMVATVDPALPVIFLETGKLFPETLAYRDELVHLLGLEDVRSVGPDRQELKALDPDGTLHARDPDLCCHIRKTHPLAAALEGFDAWITGRKRFQGGLRDALPTIEGESSTGRIKLNPLARWSGRGHRPLSDPALPAAPPAGRRRLSVDRLHAVHPPGQAGGIGAVGPLVGFGQGRMRHSR